MALVELVGGAVLGVLFGELQKEICRVKENFEMFKPKLEELEETVALLDPVIKEIEELNRLLNRPNHGTEATGLMRLLKNSIKLVSECSEIPRWDIVKQCRYGRKLVDLRKKIVEFNSVCLLAFMARDLKQNLLYSQGTTNMTIMSLNQQGLSNITMGFTDPSDLTTASSTGSSNITMSLGTFVESNTKGKIIAIKVEVRNTRGRSKALKLASMIPGVESVKLLNGEDRMIVTGVQVDAVRLINIMRNKLGHASLVSIEDVIPNGGGGGGNNSGGDGGSNGDSDGGSNSGSGGNDSNNSGNDSNNSNGGSNSSSGGGGGGNNSGGDGGSNDGGSDSNSSNGGSNCSSGGGGGGNNSDGERRQ